MSEKRTVGGGRDAPGGLAVPAGSSATTRRRFLGGVAAASLAGGESLAASPPPRDRGQPDVLDVAIIGAGLAGLTAARDLRRAGNSSFAVLEARDRVGGRTLNHRLRNGYISEAGGQWIGPGQTAVADLARELDIETFKSEYDGRTVLHMGKGFVAVDGHGEFDMNRALVDELDRLARTIPSARPWTAPRAAEFDKLSMADWLATRNMDSLELLTWELASILTAGTATSKVSFLYYLSMLNSSRGVQALEDQKDGAQETRFVGGSQILSIRMAAELRDFVHLGQPVTGIVDWDKDVAEVHTSNGILRARNVIVALSPPLCQRLSYAPVLPIARQELQRRWPAHAAMAKTAMVYSSPFWFDLGYSGQVASPEGPVIWSYDNSPQDKKLGVINAFVRASQIPSDRAMAQRAIAAIYAEAMNDQRFMSPLEFHLQDWGQEPYTITCVSPLPPGFLTSGLMPALTQNRGALIWAGTETAEIWNGYMDGAVRSGNRAALQALQALQGAGNGRS